jgi:DUF1365 family protein
MTAPGGHGSHRGVLSTEGEGHRARDESRSICEPLLGLGQVRHTRLRPVRHAFAYPTFFLLLPMRRLRTSPWPALPRNRFGLLSFHDADHGDGRADSLAWLEALLQREGLDGIDGEVWLHCFPRVLGYAFKPVSFWYCHRADGSLAAIVVEVHNTFGERHCYLLDEPGVGFGHELSARKAFHVSPFCRIEGRYRFRFMRTSPQRPGTPAERTVARIDYDDDAGPLLQTSVCGDLAPATRARIRSAFFRVPLMTVGVMARIHWQALLLWLRHVPFFSKPPPPAALVTRGTPPPP